jgi:hypothetical protein
MVMVAGGAAEGVYQGLLLRGVVWHQSSMVFCLLCGTWPAGPALQAPDWQQRGEQAHVP